MLIEVQTAHPEHVYKDNSALSSSYTQEVGKMSRNRFKATELLPVALRESSAEIKIEVLS